MAKLAGKTEEEVKALRKQYDITAAYKMVDTCAAEFAATTPYYYSVYGGENEAVETNDRKKVLVLGSGPIRIGQGIEFDFCSVHATWAFAKAGYETIIVNNNPETVSTDFDIADKLYFEPLTATETAVLRLMSQGLSNDEIAGRLGKKTGTVKFHTNNIFRKLQVQNRQQAVNRGREINLL